MKKTNINQLEKILTGSWKDDLKKLPKHLKTELRRWISVKHQLEMLKFGIIDFEEFQKRLEVIVKPEIKKSETHLCVVCRQTPVDPYQGYDTCPSCAAKI